MSSNFLNYKNKVAVSFLLGFCALIGLIFLLIRPLLTRIDEKKNKLEERRLELKYLEQEGGKLKKYQDLSKKMEESRFSIENSVVFKKEEIKLIQRLEETAKNLGIFISINSYTPPKKKSLISEGLAPTPMPAGTNKENNNSATINQPATPATSIENKSNYFMVSYIGDYNDFLNFIFKIENLNYVVKIDSIKLNSLSNLEIQRLKAERENEQVPIEEAKIEADILLSFKTF